MATHSVWPFYLSGKDMLSLKDFLLPGIKAENTINISLSHLKTQGMVAPNCYYIVLDETLEPSDKVINLKLILIMDSAGEYYLIAEESSKPEMWNNPEEMAIYFNQRTENLKSLKRNIIVTAEHLFADEFMFIQFYVIAGKSKFADIIALIKKIKKQITDYRQEYRAS